MCARPGRACRTTDYAGQTVPAYIDEGLHPTALRAAHADSCLDAVDGVLRRHRICYKSHGCLMAVELGAVELCRTVIKHWWCQTCRQSTERGSCGICSRYGCRSTWRIGLRCCLCPGTSIPCARSKHRQFQSFQDHKVPMALAADCNPDFIAADVAVADNEHGIPLDPAGAFGNDGACEGPWELTAVGSLACRRSEHLERRPPCRTLLPYRSGSTRFIPAFLRGPL
jgi:hypothetical protein